MIRSNNEIKLLLSCSKPRMDNKSADKICHLLQEEIDWDWILKAARSHQIWPILYHNLKTVCPETVPQDVLSKLQRPYLFNAARNLMLTKELLRIIEDLEKHGIEAVPFKGPALAQAAYGDITLRSFADLDIMVYARHGCELMGCKSPVHKRKEVRLMKKTWEVPKLVVLHRTEDPDGAKVLATCGSNSSPNEGWGCSTMNCAAKCN